MGDTNKRQAGAEKTQEMIAAGVAALEGTIGSFDDSGIVEAVYTAMRRVEFSPAAPS